MSDVLVPTDVDCFQGIPVVNVACGENHALAVSVRTPLSLLGDGEGS